MSATKLAENPSIVLPFLPIVKLLVAQSSPSAILTINPVDGGAGKFIVKLPEEVSAIIWSPSLAVYPSSNTVFLTQEDAAPEVP
jgi:hypothetical protein